ncbi:coiled-coil domain-containing protein [Micavibrio aeruginosavorus]|uniref:Uncharacterized protein n=1 Tax=Micavibrio aeruginosavorus EPB TaxID=349215 RepID=M4VDT9_9BACT|nr:hypothetical protein [Micavibrio aeruginosavorus]AGH97388.1 hypothetical protein A11S_564 [Micavibrio aeruginosavorus EPB]
MAESGQTPNQTNAVYDVERGTYRRIFNESTTTIGMKGAEADRALFDTAPLQSARRAMELDNNAAEQAQAIQDEISSPMDAAAIDDLATQTADIKDIQATPSPQGPALNNNVAAGANTAEKQTVEIEALSPIFEAQAKTPDARTIAAENVMDAVYESQHGHKGLRELNAMETLAERMGTTGPVNNSVRGGQAQAEQKEKERAAQAIRYSQYIRQLEENVRQNQLAVEQAQKRLDEANERVAQAEREVEEAEQNVQVAEQRVERLSEEVVVLDQKIAENAEQRAILEAEGEQLNGQIEVLKEQEANTQQEINQIDAQMTVLDGQMAANDAMVETNQQILEENLEKLNTAKEEQMAVATDNSEVFRRLNAMEANAPRDPENGDKLFVNEQGQIVNQNGDVKDIAKDDLENANALTSFERYSNLKEKSGDNLGKFIDKTVEIDDAKTQAEQAQNTVNEKTAENEQLNERRVSLEELRGYYEEGMVGIRQEIGSLKADLAKNQTELQNVVNAGEVLAQEKLKKVEELGIAKDDLAQAKADLLEKQGNLTAAQQEQLDAIKDLEQAQKDLAESQQKLENANNSADAQIGQMNDYQAWLENTDTREQILSQQINRTQILDKTPESLRTYVSTSMDNTKRLIDERYGVAPEREMVASTGNDTATSRVGTSAAKSDIDPGMDMNSAFAAAASPNQPAAATPQLPGADMDMTEQTRRAALNGQSMSMGMA